MAVLNRMCCLFNIFGFPIFVFIKILFSKIKEDKNKYHIVIFKTQTALLYFKHFNDWSAFDLTPCKPTIVVPLIASEDHVLIGKYSIIRPLLCCDASFDTFIHLRGCLLLPNLKRLFTVKFTLVAIKDTMPGQ